MLLATAETHVASKIGQFLLRQLLNTHIQSPHDYAQVFPVEPGLQVLSLLPSITPPLKHLLDRVQLTTGFFDSSLVLKDQLFQCLPQFSRPAICIMNLASASA
jgi:hypothetical protein